jgi:glycosyltransferase involved in cell wall biosynthesis
MPNSILEAMAAGLAIAGTDVGDVKRMLSSENTSFVVPANDEAALTSALLRLLWDRALSQHVGSANRDRARADFGFDVMVARYDRLYSGR